MGLLGKWVKYNELFLFIPFSRVLTYRSDPLTDFYASRLKRRGLVEGCAFWGFRLYCSPFWGLNFQAKLAKYCEFMLSKLLYRFQPNFAQRQRPQSGHSGWSQYVLNKSKMADGRRFAKSVKSQYLGNLLSNFDEIWQSEAHRPLTANRSLKFRISDNKKWRRPGVKNHKYCDISAIV